MKNLLNGLMLIVFISFCISAFGQIPRDTVINYSDNKYIFYNDIAYFFEYKNHKYDLYKDTLLLTPNINLFCIDYYDFDPVTNNIYIGNKSGSDLKLYCFNISNGNFDFYISLNYSRIGCIRNNQLYYYSWNEYYEQNLTIKELNSKQNFHSFNINEKLNSNNLSVIEIIKLSPDNFLLNVGYNEAGAIYDSKYYLFNEPELNFTEFLPDTKSKDILHEDGISVVMNDLTNKYAFFSNGILDSDYKFFSYILPIEINIQGLVIENKKINQLLVLSELDNKNKYNNYPSVLIQYNPSPFREKIMFEIDNNQLLTKSDLIHFDKFDLSLIRNMIYAKYNCSFSDDYLTAYFNLYDFYRYKKESRLENVNDKLTETDKVNLKLIQEAEEKLIN